MERLFEINNHLKIKAYQAYFSPWLSPWITLRFSQQQFCKTYWQTLYVWDTPFGLSGWCYGK